jgi:hypothetical protein
MTKLVEFTRDMRPYRKGDRYALPDPVADELVLSGGGFVVPSVFDQSAVAPEAEHERRRNLVYRTRGGQFAPRKG